MRSSKHMKQLHPGAKWLFRIQAYLGFAVLIGISLGVFANLAVALGIFKVFATVALVGIVFIAIIGEIYARLAYNRWFYEFDDDGLKMENGIIFKRYSNVPYTKVQNIDVTRGILARIIGFSSVHLQTAGYSGKNSHAEGTLPALSVEEAEKVRTLVMKKISRK